METTVRYFWFEGQHLHAILEETMEHRCVNRSQSEANFYLRPLRQPLSPVRHVLHKIAYTIRDISAILKLINDIRSIQQGS